MTEPAVVTVRPEVAAAFDAAIDARQNGAGKHGGSADALDGPHKLSDLGNAERFARAHGAEVRYVPPTKDWHVWDGRRWARDEVQAVERRVQQTAIGIFHEIPDAPTDQRQSLIKWARESQNRTRLVAMQMCAQPLPGLAVLPSAFDRDPMLLTVMNGTLDLRSAALRPHRQDDLITKLVPFSYDPAARCDRWERFMMEITNNRPELSAYLQRALGSSLTGDTRDQGFFIGYGPGANGKSVLFNVQRRLRGDYALMADFATFAEQSVDKPRPDLARLAGARMVCAEEPQAVRLSEALLKNLTGGAAVTARFLYGKEFEFVPQFKLWLGTNERPLIRATDLGMWRRVNLIPFDASFEGEREEKGLEDRLLATEGPGILAWTVAGCLMWQREGLNPPDCVRAATAEYRADSDIVGEFLAERCASGGSVDAGELYQEYMRWSADEQGERPMSKQKFGHRLSDRGIKTGHRRKGSGFVKTRDGIHLLPVEVSAASTWTNYRTSGE